MTLFNMKRPIAWTSLPACHLAEQEELHSAWDRLNDARLGVPVLSSSAVGVAIEIFGPSGLRLMVGRAEDRVVAMLILQPMGHMRWQTFQPSQLPLGPFVADPNLSTAELAESILLSGILGPILVVSLTQIDPRVAGRPADRPRTKTLDYVATGWIDIAGTFDAYWAIRGKNLRQNLRKQRNRLASIGVSPEMRVITEPGSMQDAVARYGALEGKGWKASQGTAILPGNDQGRFYTRLLERLAASGEGLVFEYWFSDRLVASEICIRRGRLLVILKTTYDETERQFSPAFLLREEELRLWFSSSEIDRVEFYGRLMEWHTRWTENSVQLHHVSVYRWEWLRQVALHLGERKRRLAARQETAEAAESSAA